MKISATIITFNEQENIQEACESVSWADEILVVDSESTDATREIAQTCGARVINRQWPGFAPQKQFATDNVTHDWVFSLDADERVSEKLKNSISQLRDLSEEQRADAYTISRRAFYLGRWIRGAGWYPNRQVRLFKRTKGRWSPRLIHESVQMANEARIENLEGDLLHYTVESVAQHHRMIGERYAPLAAQQMFADGRRTSVFKIAAAAPTAFLRSYLLKGGFRDGLAGFAIASFAAHHDFLKHLMLWELQNKR